MHTRDYLFLALGGAVFFVGSPVLMLIIDALWPQSFLPTVLAQVVGILCALLGLVLCVWANVELMRRGRGGAAVLGPIKLMKETEHLVISGPYAMCRNPMHLGIMLYQLGLCCMMNSLWTLIVPLGMLAFAYGLARFVDEPRLQQDFPQEYAQWAQRTPRFLPRIK